MKRFLLIGLDGAEPSLVEPWMAAGHLPNLARLRDIGSYLPLQSTTPPATFPAWTTCVTGVNPGRHGIFDFTELEGIGVGDQGSGARGQGSGARGQGSGVRGQGRGPGLRFVNATHRMAPALWNVLSDAGKRVGVLGVPATYPPERVNGFMVAGFDSPVATGIDRSFVYPPELYDAVRGWAFAEFQESRIGPGWHERALARLLGKIAEKERIARDLIEREPWDFFMVVFGESDTVAHHFWLFHDPESPRHRPGLQDAILEVYKRLDAAMGTLWNAAGPDVTVGVVSDHGFGGAGTGVVHLNNWLAEHGCLRFTRQADSLIKRVALGATPERWQGALFRRFRALAARAEAKSRFGGIDWTRTTAWSEELNYFPSVRVNLRGREPDGQVAPEDYDAFCGELCARLEGWAPIKKAWRRGKLYDGPFVSRAPDIVLELALENGYSHSCLRSRGGPAFRRIGADEFLGGKERGMTGSHRPAGVLFLSRPVDATWARLEDVAPTVLAELGVPGPEMEGADLVGGSGDLVGARPVQDGPSWSSALREPRSYSAEEEQVVEQRLRDLGYFE